MKTTSLILLICSLLFCLSAPLKGQSGTFTVRLPKLVYPPDEEGQGWQRPKVWGIYDALAHDDSIVVPNGRPIYALIVSGYAQNGNFDQLLVYNFARYLMEHGAYVHYAWWNNLLAPYMERPLHWDQSYPGNLGQNFLNFTTAATAEYKAKPGEDYQFVADAKRFLSAIRQHNPNAIIIVVGHSMGRGAIVHLASPWNTNVNERIDILAPIDPVGNRNYPWSTVRTHAKDFNWTRWRITRDKFLGYRRLRNDGGPINTDCVPDGPWRENYTIAKNLSNVFCRSEAPYIHQANSLRFGDNIVHLYYRFQTEFLFPFDYSDNSSDILFLHNPPPGFTVADEQAVVPTKSGGSDLGGWPNDLQLLHQCCPNGVGVAWPHDGHGEIVGYRGPGLTVPLGVRVNTSPECGLCPNLIWPERKKVNGEWSNGDTTLRRTYLENLENLPAGSTWEHRPTKPDLSLVDSGLIDLFNNIVTEVRPESKIPERFLLEQNYPNPFNPSTTIKYSIPKSDNVNITVFDVLGREVAVLVNQYKTAGTYSLEFNASRISSGLYFYRLKAGNFIKTRKMVLIK